MTDTRTYISTPEEGTRTRDVMVGHEGFPCPPTRGQVDTCAEAWTEWQYRSNLLRRPPARPTIRP